ncbi:MAG: DUF3857 domain-containing protein [Psychroserpens sp.]|uniref:DUF3857 domain-containing protein n=1 Tax=Psychroserpens sp. TaxID=2020870 RepID=UPI0030014C49
MKYLSLLILFFFASANSQSNFNSESFSVTKDDLELNIYAKDSTANALVIREIGSTHLNSRTYNLETEVEKKIKIFNKNGFDHAEVFITLFKESKRKKESVESIKATVYNLENGTIEKTKLKKISVFEEAVSDNLISVKIVFPKVKEGSVIVYSYTKVSPFFYKYKGWNFQDDIPKLYSEYNASIPAILEYHAKLVGDLKFTTKELSIKKYCFRASGSDGNCNVSKYVIKDISAFIEEDFMTTKDNYLARIEYELKTIRGYNGRTKHLTKTWKNVDRKILTETSLGNEFIRVNQFENLLSKKITSETNNLEKAKMILRYVQENYIWNGNDLILNGVSTKNLVEKKTGNVGDINMLLHHLLGNNDIPVKPIILSTRDNGFATVLYPVISDFNYLIIKAEIDGKTYLLDATDEYLSFGEIPFRCLNHYGRVLDFVNGSDWYEIGINEASLVEYSYILNIDTDQNMTGNVDFNASRYHALSLKEDYFEKEEQFIEDFKNEYDDIEISNFKVTTTDKASTKFLINFDVNKTTEAIGNSIYVNPILFQFFKKNPFKLQERTYPIDFGFKDTYIYKIKIKIDKSYNIIEIPETVNLILPNKDASLMFTAQKKNNQVSLYFKLSFKKPLYESLYYEALKKIMSTVVDLQNNSLIVLEKKE